MKILNFKSLLIIFISTFLLTACGKSKEPAEEVVLKNYLQAIAEGKTKEAVEMIDFSAMSAEDKAAIQDKLTPMFKEMKEKGVDLKKGIQSIEVTNKVLSDDKKTAVLRYTVTYGDGTAEKGSENLINIDGQWKIYLD